MEPRIVDVQLPVTDTSPAIAEMQTNAPVQPAEVGSAALQAAEILKPTVEIVTGRIIGLDPAARIEITNHPLFVGDKGRHSGNYNKGRSGL